MNGGPREATVLDLLVAALPHLRGGLRRASAEPAARLLYEHLGLDACAVVSRDEVLAFVGQGEDHHVVGGPNLTALTLRTFETGQPAVARTKEEIGCPVPGCPLTAIAIAPLVVRDEIVGALKLYRAGTPIGERDERVAIGLARVFSVYLELAALDARAALVTQAELDALRAQISPHFLFNTLTTIAALTRIDAQRAHDLLIDFADFFRETLAQRGELVTLDEELEHVERYVRFERARFAQLDFRIDVDPRARTAQVPILVVQPLVENAIGHGIAPRGGAGSVRVEARRDGEAWKIAVVDDGVGFDAKRALGDGRPSGLGVGLPNVHARLIGMFGPSAGLDVTSGPDGSRVAFRVPLVPPERPA